MSNYYQQQPQQIAYEILNTLPLYIESQLDEINREIVVDFFINFIYKCDAVQSCTDITSITPGTVYTSTMLYDSKQIKPYIQNTGPELGPLRGTKIQNLFNMLRQTTPFRNNKNNDQQLKKERGFGVCIQALPMIYDVINQVIQNLQEQQQQ